MKIGIDALFLAPKSKRGIERVARGLIRGLGSLAEAGQIRLYSAREGCGIAGGPFSEKRFFFRADNRPARILAQQALLGPAAAYDGRDALLCPANLCPPLCSVPRVLLAHDLAPLRFPDDFSPLERMVWKVLLPLSARTAERIVTVSEFSARELAGLLGVSRDKIRVVHPGVDECFRGDRDDAPRPDAPEILCVSKDAGFKNLDRLLKSCEILTKRGRDFALVVAGLPEKGRARLKAGARRFGMEKRLRLAGPLTDAELAALYRRAALLINPSLYEGFGLPLLEAMATGTPVAASRACAEAAGDAGLLFSPENPAEMAGAMEKILTDAALARELREKGRLRARAFTWDRAARAVWDVLREAVNIKNK